MSRTTGLALGMLATFAVTVAILLVVMPGPRKATDYMVIGCVATLLCLLLLFVVLIKFKPSRDQPEPTEPRAETEARPTEARPTEPRPTEPRP